MNTKSIEGIRITLETMHEKLINTRESIENLTIFTGEASTNLLDAEMHLESALDELYLILQ